MSLAQKKLVTQLKSYHKDMRREMIKLRDDGLTLPLAIATETLKLWKDEVSKFLEDNGLSRHALAFSEVSLPPYGLLEGLIESIEAHLNLLRKIIDDISGSAGDGKEAKKISDKKVFVVCGRDTTNLYELLEIIEKRFGLGYETLGKGSGGGRAVIEEFTRTASTASFAFILRAPYDMVKVDGKKEYVQERPNVIFELGWFYGRLGRDRVCILLKEGTKIHSDLDAIPRIEFKSSVTERVAEIEEKLKVAGLI